MTRLVTLLALTATVCMAPHIAHAQLNVGGVYIDGDGVLREASTLSQTDQLKLLRAQAFEQASSTDLNAASPLRKVSLKRLEQTVVDLHAAGEPLPGEIRHLAGLQQVQYVFLFPDERDVVLAGPAEGWQQLPTGDVVGSHSLHPVLHLDDLIVALRFAFDDRQPDAFLGCSIEPTADGLRAHEAFLRQMGGQPDPTRLPQVLRGFEQAVGPQEIKLYGAPPSSRFALQMLAADYRLKRIAMGHDPPPLKRMSNYLELVARTGTAEMQHRWWFVSHFDAIRHTPDRLAFEFEGHGLKVQTAPTTPAPVSGPAPPKPGRQALLFADGFTKQFPQIAAKVPVFNELKNLVSLAVAAALIRNEKDAVQKDSGAGLEGSPIRLWRPRHFLDETACPLAVHSVPRRTPSLANVAAHPRSLVFSVSGGVEIDPAWLAKEKLKPARDEKLGESRAATVMPRQPDRWWWD